MAIEEKLVAAAPVGGGDIISEREVSEPASAEVGGSSGGSSEKLVEVLKSEEVARSGDVKDVKDIKDIKDIKEVKEVKEVKELDFTLFDPLSLIAEKLSGKKDKEFEDGLRRVLGNPSNESMISDIKRLGFNQEQLDYLNDFAAASVTIGVDGKAAMEKSRSVAQKQILEDNIVKAHGEVGLERVRAQISAWCDKYSFPIDALYALSPSEQRGLFDTIEKFANQTQSDGTGMPGVRGMPQETIPPAYRKFFNRKYGKN